MVATMMLRKVVGEGGEEAKQRKSHKMKKIGICPVEWGPPLCKDLVAFTLLVVLLITHSQLPTNPSVIMADLDQKNLHKICNFRPECNSIVSAAAYNKSTAFTLQERVHVTCWQSLHTLPV
jgi:hypothetical protein